jgi:predicted kinase
MVEGLKLAEKEIPQAERAQALERARSHWLLALTELEEPSRKPRLVLVAGLPGTGKSRLAHALAEAAGFSLIRSDVIRKELAGLPADAPTPPQDPALLYSREATERTYTECLRRAEQGLFEGERVIVDATFRDEPKRQMFLKLAQKLGINSAILVCQVDADVARERLQRRVGDASDADWTIYQQISASWERLGDQSAPASRTISTDGSPDEVLARASEALCELGIEGN